MCQALLKRQTYYGLKSFVYSIFNYLLNFCMKNILSALLLILSLSLTSYSVHAQHSATKLWATDSTLAIPESVLYDAEANLLYASLIDGRSDSADGVGGIAKVGLDGKIIND